MTDTTPDIVAAAYALQTYRRLAQKHGVMTHTQSRRLVGHPRRPKYDHGIQFLLRRDEMWLDGDRNLMISDTLLTTPVTPPKPAPKPKREPKPALGENIALHVTVDGETRQLGHEDVQAVQIAWRAIMRQHAKHVAAHDGAADVGKFTPSSVRRSVRNEKRDACEFGLNVLAALKMIEPDTAGEITTAADPWLPERCVRARKNVYW